MARIRTLTSEAHDVRVHKTEVDATYQLVNGPDGETYFHLSTYGSDNRKSDPKVSQTFQVNAEIAAQLIQALTAAFAS
jgi:hypothetical protein